MSCRTLSFLCFLVAALAAAPVRADTVRRCVDALGNAVYTDRSCDAVQARPREAPAPAAGARFTGGFAARGCARRPEQLLAGVRGALEAHDVNRLANWYHWTGTGTGAARYLMDQLEGIAKRPLVAIELVYPGETGVRVGSGETGVRVGSPQPSSENGSSTEPTLTPVSPALPGPADAGPPPESLRVQQIRDAADLTAVSTDFRLVRNAGCWWIEL